MKSYVVVVLAALLSGYYAEGNSFFLATGETETFLTMGRCEREAQSKHEDGGVRYSGYECRYKLLLFTLEKKRYSNGKLLSTTE